MTNGAAVAAANRRRIVTLEMRQAMAERQRGRTHSEATKAAIGLGISRAWTPERRAALAEANRLRRGERRAPEVVAAIRERLIGHAVSPEQRAKVSASLRGNQNGNLATVKGECIYCFEIATTWDHVIPRGRPGAEAPGNIVPACGTCNRSKGQRTPEEWFAAMTDGRRDHSAARRRRHTSA